MSRKRRLAFILLFCCFGLVALVVNIIFFFPLESVRLKLENELQKTIPWPIQIEKVSLHYIHPGIELTNITITKTSSEIDLKTQKPKITQILLPRIFVSTTWKDMIFHLPKKQLHRIKAEIDSLGGTLTLEAQLTDSSVNISSSTMDAAPIQNQTDTVPIQTPSQQAPSEITETSQIPNPQPNNQSMRGNQTQRPTLRYQVQANAKQLNFLELGKLFGLPLQGALSFDFDGILAITDQGQLVPQLSLGNLHIETSGVSLGDGKTLVDLGTFISPDPMLPSGVREPNPIPKIRLANFDSQFELQKGKFQIKSWQNQKNVSDSLIQFSLEGSLDVGQPFATSTLHFFGKMGIEPNTTKALIYDILSKSKNPNLANNAKDFTSILENNINKNRRSDGQFGFDIKGTITKPIIKSNRMHP